MAFDISVDVCDPRLLRSAASAGVYPRASVISVSDRVTAPVLVLNDRTPVLFKVILLRASSYDFESPLPSVRAP